MPATAKPRRTKKEQAEATRSAIIDAAIRLFAKSGYVSTTTQDIARAIKMTPGVLYWHFKDKEEVLVAVIAELERRLAAELTAESDAISDKLEGHMPAFDAELEPAEVDLLARWLITVAPAAKL